MIMKYFVTVEKNFKNRINIYAWESELKVGEGAKKGVEKEKLKENSLL